MIPKSLSATALQVASQCLSRFAAEHMVYGRSASGTAASLGSAVHGALEIFVKGVYLEKKFPRELKTLLDLFEMSYLAIFGDIDKKSEDYKDGVTMLKAWYERNTIESENREVLSCEQKTHFDLNLAGHIIPVNYIWDRFDENPNGPEDEGLVLTVVDYKTNRWNFNHEELRQKVQARIYALAAQLANPDATRVWVEFDMLRHDGPLAVCFSIEDNRETYRWLKKQSQRILATPADTAPETLNPECLFCVKKVTCQVRQRNIAAGGIASLNREQAIDMRAQIEMQNKANDAALKEIDAVLLQEGKKEDVLQIEGDAFIATFGVRGVRNVDPERARKVMGETLWNKYGSASLSMATVDKLLKGDDLSTAQKTQLRGLISKTYGDPSVKTKPKPEFSV